MRRGRNHGGHREHERAEGNQRNPRRRAVVPAILETITISNTTKKNLAHGVKKRNPEPPRGSCPQRSRSRYARWTDARRRLIASRQVKVKARTHPHQIAPVAMPAGSGTIRPGPFRPAFRRRRRSPGAGASTPRRVRTPRPFARSTFDRWRSPQRIKCACKISPACRVPSRRAIRAPPLPVPPVPATARPPARGCPDDRDRDAT